MKKVFTLTLGDMKNILRDPMLLLSMLAPILLTLVLRYGLPVIEDFVMVRFDFDLSVYHVLIMSFALILCPLMIGMLTGFILLDERDENLLSYYSITPIGRTGYLLYRLTLPFLLSCLLTNFLIVFSDIHELHLSLIAIILLVSLSAPLITLFLGVFASNKVEGLALSKLAGFIVIAPIISFFVDSPIAYVAGILPPFWVAEAYSAIYTISAFMWGHLFAGFLISFIFLITLYRLFNKKAY